MQNTQTTAQSVQSVQSAKTASAILAQRKAQAQQIAAAKAAAAAAKKAASKKPGIIATIRAQVMQATKQNPVTQTQILAHLVKQFPAHTKQAMRKTVSTQLNISSKQLTCRAEREANVIYNVFYKNNVAHYYFTK